MKPSEIAPPPPSTVSGPKEPGCAGASSDADAAVPADIRGPSAEDWDRYKRTIVNMYGTMKLKDIRERMAKDYGFHATYVNPAASGSSPSRLSARQGKPAYALAENACTTGASTNGACRST